MHFLGYFSCHNGYKCLDSHGKLFISKDVVFDEYTFSFANKYTSLQMPSFHFRLLPLGVLLLIIVLSSSQNATHESPVVFPSLFHLMYHYQISYMMIFFLLSCLVHFLSISDFTDLIVPSCSRSIHPMQTRSKSTIVKPHRYPTLLLLNKPCPLIFGLRPCKMITYIFITF